MPHAPSASVRDGGNDLRTMGGRNLYFDIKVRTQNSDFYIYIIVTILVTVGDHKYLVTNQTFICLWGITFISDIVRNIWVAALSCKLVHSVPHGGQAARLPGSAYWMHAHGAKIMIALQSTSFQYGQSLDCVWSNWDLIVAGCVEGPTRTKCMWHLASRQNIMCDKQPRPHTCCQKSLSHALSVLLPSIMPVRASFQNVHFAQWTFWRIGVAIHFGCHFFVAQARRRNWWCAWRSWIISLG